VLTPSPGRLNGSVFQGEHQHVQETQSGHGAGPNITGSSSEYEILCGPLLNYQRMSEEGANVFWHGSVLIVTKPAQQPPILELNSLGAWNPSHTKRKTLGRQTIEGLKLYSDPDKTFWRFTLRLPLAEFEAKWQYAIQNIHFLTKVSEHSSRQFVVPSVTESMRIMFHSCNGFSVGTDEDFWSGRRTCSCQSKRCLTSSNRSCTME